MSTLKFAETYNLVAFLKKPEESNGFESIIDFLNASSIKYALTVNPTVYESCIQQFWATAKAKTVNGERQIQALVDKKKVIITEKSVRSDLMLEDAEGTECLPNDVIFEQLTLMGAKTTAWNEFSSTMASAIICLATNQKFNFSKYIFDNMMKNLEGGVKLHMYPRFMQVFLVKQVKGMSKHKGIYVIPSHTKKIFTNMKREGKGFSGRITPLFQTMMVQAPEDMGEDLVAPTDFHFTPIFTQPSSSKPQKKKVLDLEEAKTAQAKEIASLKKRVKQLENRRKSRPSGLKMLRKVGSARRVESSNDVSLGAQEDASKQGRKIDDLDADAEVTLIDDTQERFDEEMLFDVQDDLQSEEVVTEKEVAKKEVSAADPVTTAGEVVTTVSATTTVDELTMAQTLIKIKAAKPKAVTITAIIITTAVASTRPNAKGIVFHDQEDQASAFTPIVSSSQLPQSKDKGKGKIVESKKPLKKKDQVPLDEELALRLQAEEQAELERERLKGKSYEEIQKLFDKAYKQVSSFVPMDSEVVKSSMTRTERSSKRAGDELKSDKSKKQKIDEHVEVEKDDQEEAEMKRHIKIVKCKIDKDGRIGYFKLIRADRRSKRYSSKIKMLQDIDREDLEILWKLVKAKHENTRLEEDYERVLWGDLKLMFEPDIKSEVWRNLQGYKVTVWKLFDNYGVHFVRFKNLHIFMLVKKRYPLTPITITNMLNKKLQADH
ncbi:hypothetical protein Tco_0557994 [Tanacetum coccineum]